MATALLALTERNELRIMDPKEGDLKINWDPDSPDEVELAEEQFDAAREKGMTAYAVDKKGQKTTELKEFDPKVRAIIMAPAPKRG